MDLVTSLDNKWVKLFRRALRGAGPEGDEPIGVEGPRLVEEALLSGLQPEALLLSESTEERATEILRESSRGGRDGARLRILRTTDKIFRGVAGTETPQGVAALFRQPVWTLEDVLRGPGAMRSSAALVIVLVGVQDPGNVGTAIRSAEAFGATGAVATRGTTDPWSGKAVRASAGSALRLPLLRGMAPPVLLAQLRMARIRIFAAMPEPAGERSAAGHVLAQSDMREPTAVLVGSEGAGLGSEVAHAADACITIPTRGAVESLNAGVAASIALYEAARQREFALCERA